MRGQVRSAGFPLLSPAESLLDQTTRNRAFSELMEHAHVQLRAGAKAWSCRKTVARKAKVVEQFQADLPCPDLSLKIFRFPFAPQISGIIPAVSFPPRGRIRIVRTRKRCGGRESVGARTGSQGGHRPVSGPRRDRRTAQLRTAKPCGSDTRCWCQVGGVLLKPDRASQNISPSTRVTRRIRRQEERGISRKAIVQGMSDCSAVPVSRVRSCAFLHARPRVQQAPGIPCALFFGRDDFQSPDETRRGNAKDTCRRRERKARRGLRGVAIPATS